MKKTILKQSLSALGVYSVLFVSKASAELIRPDDRPPDVNNGNLRDNVTSIINGILGFLGLVAVGFVIYAGFLMVTSAGDEEKLGTGKKIITYAAIGIVIILLSYVIIQTFVDVGQGGETTN